MAQSLIRLRSRAAPSQTMRCCRRARCLTAQNLAAGRSRAQAGMATLMPGMWTGTSLERGPADWLPLQVGSCLRVLSFPYWLRVHVSSACHHQ